MIGCGHNRDYLRLRRRIVWNRSLTPQERRHRLDALEFAYYGRAPRWCCKGCQTESAKVAERTRELEDAL
jgi:hypothetical protein